MAEFSFVDGGIPTATNWNANVRDQLVIICTSSTRPSSPSAGRRIYETDTGKEYVYVSSTWTLCGDNAVYGAWTSYTPSWTSAGTQPALGNGVLAGKYRITGKTVELVVSVVFGSTTTWGTGQWYFTLPASVTHAFYCFGICMCYGSSNYFMGALQTAASGTYFLAWAPTSTANPAMVAVTATSPFTWANTNSIYMQMQLSIA